MMPDAESIVNLLELGFEIKDKEYEDVPSWSFTTNPGFTGKLPAY